MCASVVVSTLVMCVVVVVHRDSEVIVWAVINTPVSPSPFPSNWWQEDRKEQSAVGTHQEIPPTSLRNEWWRHALLVEKKHFGTFSLLSFKI